MGNTASTTPATPPEEQLDEPVTDKHTDVGEMVVPSRNSSSGGKARRRGSKRGGGGGRSAEPKGSLVRFAASSMQGWRPSNEDHHLLRPSITIPLPSAQWGGDITLRDHSLFAVFDGHGGGWTSHYAGNNMCRVLCARKEWSSYLALSEGERADVPGIELLKAALAGAFVDLDDELYRIHLGTFVPDPSTNAGGEGRDDGGDISNSTRSSSPGVPPKGPKADSKKGSKPVPSPAIVSEFDLAFLKGDRSGSTSVAVLLTPSHIICANAGDSRCILVRSGVAFPMSFDHKPTTACEHGRIVNASGRVHMKRVDGDLAVSRGLGDFRFKGNSDLKVEHQKVSSSPDMLVNPRDPGSDEMIILACDGIWDVLSNQECAKTVQGLLDEGETNVDMVCEEVLDICLEKDSRDNMTFCMIALPACKMMTEEQKTRSGKGGVAARREAREEKGVTPGQSRRARRAAAKAERAAKKAAREGAVAAASAAAAQQIVVPATTAE
eukprot:CAMPEP_0181053100 /NCGR_PEP_ID=MMETSP1070-20121207/17932_1 /TAXON_ID=265543 /ORGANISM="Minutocellus polymorphus, Strain NH13" /LENGTH=493 /DNA_ID=CAMNT_0023132215 /DNA_START=30 /DNA_END=1511 /DNA_ORIENTATION=-